MTRLATTGSLRAKGTRGDLGDRVYQALRDGIIDGSIAPGQRLVELAICEWLDVSRTPARDALRRLQSDGLAEPAPGGGLQVVQYDVNALYELYLVREVLEGTAAAEAARNAKPAEVHALEESIDRQRGMARNIQAFTAENKHFHHRLYEAAHNRFLVRTLQSLTDSVSLLGPTAIDTAEWVKQATGQHARITEAIGRRDADEAAEAMREHMRDGFKRRLAAFKKAPKRLFTPA